MRAADYRKEFEEAGTARLFSELMEWVYPPHPERPNKAQVDNLFRLTGDLRVPLTKRHGPQQFCLRDGRLIRVWRFEIDKDTIMWVLTANERGTTIEYIGESQKLKNKIIEVFNLDEQALAA